MQREEKTEEQVGHKGMSQEEIQDVKGLIILVFIFNDMCMHVWEWGICTCECGCLKSPKEGTGVPEAGVAGNCERSSIGAGNQTMAL